MDNASSRNPIPGEDLRAPPPTPGDATPQSSGSLGQDEEYILRSEDDEIFNPGMTNFPNRFGPISRPNGAVQLSSRGTTPDAPENTRISEDVTQTTGLKSSASESTEVRPSLECIPDTKISEDVVTQTTGLNSSASESIEVKTSPESIPATRISEDVTQTSLESIPDSSHETVNSVTTEAGERKEESNEMTPMSPSESLPRGILANPALQMVIPRLTEIVEEEKEGREPEPSLRKRRSLGRNN